MSHFSDSNRSYSTNTGLYQSPDYNRSSHGSATLPVNMRYDDSMLHRMGGGHLDDYRQPFAPSKSSSPNGTPYHRPHESNMPICPSRLTLPLLYHRHIVTHLLMPCILQTYVLIKPSSPEVVPLVSSPMATRTRSHQGHILSLPLLPKPEVIRPR